MKKREGFSRQLITQRIVLWGAVCLLGSVIAIGAPARTTEKAGAVDRFKTAEGDLVVKPINHATFALEWNGKTIVVDPVGGARRFEGLPRPDLVLLTDIHPDHLDGPTLASIAVDKTAVVAPKAVAEKLPEKVRGKTTVLANGDTKSVLGIQIEALPMYNTTPERLKFHEKGRGNAYVLTLGGTRVYISGDTEGIPEMRALKNIDIGFVCMNLPYTMTVEQAADAVRAFKPKVVYPYHYRGSDVQKFKQLVGPDSGVDVRLRDWYKQ